MLKKYSQVRVARGARLFFFIQPVILLSCDWLSGVGVAQLVSARLLKQEVPIRYSVTSTFALTFL